MCGASISGAGSSAFANTLKHKAESAGVEVVEVGEPGHGYGSSWRAALTAFNAAAGALRGQLSTTRERAMPARFDC